MIIHRVEAVVAVGWRRVAGLAFAGLIVTGAGGCTGPSSPPASSAFAARARQVAAAWDRSPLRRAWSSGVVLLGSDQLTSVPGPGFPGQTKLAFVAGAYVLAGRLPAGPREGRVRWAGGAEATVPLIGPARALQQLSAVSPCPGGAGNCGHLTVTGARPATLTVETSRGQATVPAWAFSVRELSFPIIRAALAPDGYVTVPVGGASFADAAPATAHDANGAFNGTVGAEVGADGRTLTVLLATGACDTQWGGLQYSTSSAVVIGSWSYTPARTGPCPASLIVRSAIVRLARPLGDRTLLDAATGRPVAPGRP
jgi:hypothetical protein